MKNHIKSQKDFISSYFFARLSTFAYSEVLTRKQFENLDIENCEILSQDEEAVFYKLNKFNLNENDIIFTNYKLINELFSHLRKVSEFKNITLITNQQDEMIQQNLYNKKPNCISRWFSINVEHMANDLKALPLGLSNEYSPKNPKAEDFFKLYENMKDTKDIALYINYRANTNFSARKDIYDVFSNKEWAVIDEPNLQINSYLSKIQKNLFVLCPWGNGVDTHRVWETLYSGSIPVIKNHQTFSTLKDLPVLFVNNYEEINLDLLNKFAEEFYSNTFNYEKLKMDYWENLINNNNKLEPSINKIFQENKFYILRIKIKLFSLAKIENYKKRILFNLNKVKKIPKKLGMIK